jgi:outer membrane receptor protein involved in Fe transport
MLLCSCATACFISGPVSAQTTDAAASGASVDPAAAAQGRAKPAAAAAEIVVTGSRIRSNGNQAPTPVTVIGTAQLQATAPSNLADAVNQLPQLASSTTTKTGTYNVGNGAAGANFLNLRGFGANRTLVLLDGRRVVPATVSGIVDANIMPSALVSRVDVVTGGASAAYGSDAVTGVVNFVLDTKFKGIKAEVQSGVTQAGDDGQYRAELTGGWGFANDRGHVIASGSYADNRGALNPGDRSWYHGWKVIPNPAFVAGNGQPRQIVAPDVNFSAATQGGLITGGPLKGITFDANGQPLPFQYGSVGGVYMTGGQHSDTADAIPLDTPLKQANFFTHASYAFSPAFTLFGEFNYGYSKATSYSISALKLANLTISHDNAFLPDSIRQQMTALGVTTLPFGTTNQNLGVIEPINKRELLRFLAGANGDLGGSWSWNAYYQYGRTRSDNIVKNLLITNNYNRAIDARNVNGKIVCAVNADASSANDDPSCVPLDIFGVGVASQAAINYVDGTGFFRSFLTEQVGSASIQGKPLSLWAGPISIAAGAEYRKEQASGRADALSLSNAYFAGNFKPTVGQYTVVEGFAEVLAPLITDAPFTKNLDLNAAVRETHYSISGNVTTWKAGLTWQPIDDIRFRVTRSHDIRAPNINDLFLGGQLSSNQSVNDPQNGSAQTVGINVLTSGNRNLKPEVSNTWVVGTVLTPRFLRGFSAAIDYYNIKIRNTITSLTAQQIVDRCFGGNAALCDLISRDASGHITQIQNSVVNLAKENGSGLDVELGYRRDLEDFSSSLKGAVTLRALGSFVFSHYTFDGITKDSSRGENSGITGLPRWRLTVDLGYENEGFQVVGTMRAVSSGKYDDSYVEGIDIDNNHIAGAAFFDAYVAQRIPVGRSHAQLFLKVENLFDKAPPVAAGFGAQPYVQYGANPSLYDVLGRTFRVGVRFNY